LIVDTTTRDTTVGGANIGVIAVRCALTALPIVDIDAVPGERIARVECTGVAVFAEVLLVSTAVFWIASVKGAGVAIVTVVRGEATGSAYITTTFQTCITQRAVSVVLASFGHYGNVLAPVSGAEIQCTRVAVIAVVAAGAAVGDSLDLAGTVGATVVRAGVPVIAFKVEYAAVVDRRNVTLPCEAFCGLADAYDTVGGRVAACRIVCRVVTAYLRSARSV